MTDRASLLGIAISTLLLAALSAPTQACVRITAVARRTICDVPWQSQRAANRDRSGTHGARIMHNGLQVPCTTRLAGHCSTRTERGGFELGFGASAVGATL